MSLFSGSIHHQPNCYWPSAAGATNAATTTTTLGLGLTAAHMNAGLGSGWFNAGGAAILGGASGSNGRQQQQIIQQHQQHHYNTGLGSGGAATALSTFPVDVIGAAAGAGRMVDSSLCYGRAVQPPVPSAAAATATKPTSLLLNHQRGALKAAALTSGTRGPGGVKNNTRSNMVIMAAGQSSQEAASVLATTTNGGLALATMGGGGGGGGGGEEGGGDYKVSLGEVVSSPTCTYDVFEFLGKGTFGQVLKCWKSDTREVVALKVLKSIPSYAKQGEIEIEMLSKLSAISPEEYNFVRAYESFQHCGHICIVFELLQINLYDYLKQSRFKPMPLKHIRPIAQQVLVCLEKLSELGIVHADLKPENIMLLDPDRQPFRVKVIDFGSAAPRSHVCTTSYLQSRYYRAPEVILGLPYDEAIDIWSLGCVLAELFLGWPLFPGASEYEQISYICQTVGPPPVSMLNRNVSKTRKFFNQQLSGDWTLKIPQQIEAESGVQPRETRKFIFSSLSDMVSSSAHHSTTTATTKGMSLSLVESLDCYEFVNLLKAMLEFSPSRRVTPSQALHSRFVTMRHLAAYTGTQSVQEWIQCMQVCCQARTTASFSPVQHPHHHPSPPSLSPSTHPHHHHHRQQLLAAMAAASISASAQATPTGHAPPSAAATSGQHHQPFFGRVGIGPFQHPHQPHAHTHTTHIANPHILTLTSPAVPSLEQYLCSLAVATATANSSGSSVGNGSAVATPTTTLTLLSNHGILSEKMGLSHHSDRQQQCSWGVDADTGYVSADSSPSTVKMDGELPMFFSETSSLASGQLGPAHLGPGGVLGTAVGTSAMVTPLHTLLPSPSSPTLNTLSSQAPTPLHKSHHHSIPSSTHPQYPMLIPFLSSAHPHHLHPHPHHLHQHQMAAAVGSGAANLSALTARELATACCYGYVP